MLALKCKTFAWSLYRCLFHEQRVYMSSGGPAALRNRKAKSFWTPPKSLVDYRRILAVGGSGGDGCISLLRIWANDHAGPDGGDGGSGGHVVFEASTEVRDLQHVDTVIKADHGEKGFNKDCHGKSAKHIVVKVPIGTLIKSEDGRVVGDLAVEGSLFVAARGGAGGHGNHFFATEVNHTPQIAEFGGEGEKIAYTLEMRCMADIGLIGFPNAGKSTLLQAISRARPKVAPYPFTTLKPYIGMVQYDDMEQLAVADLPGLVVDSHKNRGLGIGFLRHAERCSVLAMVLDLSVPRPWEQLDALRHELSQFSPELATRPQLLIANKMDIPNAQENLLELQYNLETEVVPISGKTGHNLSQLLRRFREIHDKFKLEHECLITEENNK